jgi:hypothetical protein
MKYHRPIGFIVWTLDAGRFTIKRLVELKEEQRIMAAPLAPIFVGHVDNMSIVYLDQHGNPMLASPTPDSAPTWAATTPATGTLAAASSGLSAVYTAVAAGSDVVTLTAIVGGTTYSATLDITVSNEPQVLTSVGILSTVV